MSSNSLVYFLMVGLAFRQGDPVLGWTTVAAWIAENLYVMLRPKVRSDLARLERNRGTP